MKATAPEDSGLVRRHLQTKLAEPFRQRSVEAFRIVFETKGTHKVIGLPAPHGVAAHLLFHHFLKPEVERLVEVHVGQYR